MNNHCPRCMIKDDYSKNLEFISPGYSFCSVHGGLTFKEYWQAVEELNAKKMMEVAEEIKLRGRYQIHVYLWHLEIFWAIRDYYDAWHDKTVKRGFRIAWKGRRVLPSNLLDKEVNV